MLIACYLQNRILIKPDRKCLKEAFTSYKLLTRYLRTFRYIIYNDILSVNKDKFKPTVYKAILISYILISKQY